MMQRSIKSWNRLKQSRKLSALVYLADRGAIIKEHLFRQPGQVLQIEHGLMKVSSG